MFWFVYGRSSPGLAAFLQKNDTEMLEFTVIILAVWAVVLVGTAIDSEENE